MNQELADLPDCRAFSMLWQPPFPQSPTPQPLDSQGGALDAPMQAVSQVREIAASQG
jgi:hypothetical protein